MAFRSFIYLDAKKVEDYLDVLGEGSTQSRKKKAIGASAMLGPVKAGAGVEADYSPNHSPSARYNLLERKLTERLNDDFFDATQKSCDIKTVPSMSIIKFSGYVRIPESFDKLNLIKQYIQPLRDAGMITLEGDPATNEFALSFFEQTSADIPILISGNKVNLSSKLKMDNFVDSSHQDLEDLEDEELFFLCKVHSLDTNNEVTIFDPAKDFLKMNRALRRSMTETEGLEKIIEKGPILKVEIIAIYH